MAAIPQVRIGSWVAAALVVAALAAAALFATWRLEESVTPDAAPVLSISATPRAPALEAPGPARRARVMDAPPAIAPDSAAAPAARGEGVLSALRCASVEQRRRNPDCAQVHSYADADGRDLAPAPVAGVQSRDGALGRAILRGVNARAENYALGEAQKYADPRDDPLYEEGTDPSTAALRPCPAGTMPHGDGRERRGQTCRPMR